MNALPKKRRWYQFSLLTLLGVITLGAVWLGWTMNYLRSLEGQWAALERIDAMPTSRPDGSGISYNAEPATVLGSAFPGRLNPKWRLVRALDAIEASKARAAAQEIPALPHLVELELAAPNLTDYDLQTLGSLRGLKALTISSNFVTGKFLAVGTLHDTLETLDIQSQDFDHDGVLKIGECTHLKTLAFRDEHHVGIRQGISDWSFLQKLTQLEELTLAGDFPDDALAALVKMPALRHLSISSGRLTDQGVKEIAKCQSIEVLALGLPLTEEISRSLKSMQNLKTVYCMGSMIDPSDLEKARPGLKVVLPRFGPGPGSP